MPGTGGKASGPAVRAHEAAADALRQWFETREGFEAVRSFVAARLRQVPEDLLPDDGEDLLHDYLLYLLGVLPTLVPRHPQVFAALSQGDFQPLLRRAWQEFVSALREQARSKDANPGRYIYRRLRETAKASSSLRTVRRAGGVWYQPLDASPGDPPLYPDPDLLTSLVPPHPPPGSGPGTRHIFRQKFLHTALLWFWDELCLELGPGLVAIRNLAWTLKPLYVALYPPRLHDPGSMEANEDGNLAEKMDQQPSEAPDPEQCAILRSQGEGLALLVPELCALLGPEACQVLVLRFCQDSLLTQRETARRLGLGSASRVCRLEARAMETIRKFLRSRMASDLEEVAGEVRRDFIGRLCAACNNLHPCP